MTVDRQRKQVLVSGRDVLDPVDLAGVAYRITGSGALVIALDDLGDLEVACAVRHRPIRMIQSRREVAR